MKTLSDSMLLTPVRRLRPGRLAEGRYLSGRKLNVGSLVLGACIGAVTCLDIGPLLAAENTPEASGTANASLADQYSYAIGLDIGGNFRRQDMAINVEQVMAGLNDGLRGAEPRFDEQSLATAMQEFQTLLRNKAMQQQQQAGVENRKQGEAFLAQNAQEDGIQVTPSGLQYKVLEAGDGPTPGMRDTVRCNYRGTLIDGTEFDASANHGGPIEFPVRGVIQGWTEALQLMQVGAKWQLFIPADLAYGDTPPGPPIQAGSVLLFEIELVGISEK